MMKYFFPTLPLRTLGALIIQILNFASHHVMMAGLEYSYTPTATDGQTWSTQSIVLAVCILTVVLVFGLLSINMTRMKLSRAALDMIVLRFKKELANTVAQVAEEKENTRKQRLAKERLWRMLELINSARPLFRDYALATAIADFEAPEALAPTLNTNAAKDKDRDGNSPGGVNSGQSPLHVTETKVQGPAGVAAMLPENLQPKIKPSSALHIFTQLCGPVQLNAPVRDQTAREVRLEHLVAHPVTLELLKDAMIKDASVENLLMYLDIRRYKVCPDERLRALYAREIYDTFIVRNVTDH
jgi:hypothetical protein